MREIIWNTEEAVAATGGESTSNWQASSVSIDSRSIVPGDLFVAIKGETSDGHDYVSHAAANGAAAAVVSHKPKNIPENFPLLIVKDTVKALEALGRYARQRTRAKIIGVTGSVGKTSTKEMLKAALQVQGEVYASAGNLNNHYGVPLSLARLPRDVDFGVFELGMNHAGEISSLSKMVKPHAGLITTVEAVHLEFFDSVEKIADAKAEIFDGLETGGTAILNKDNPHYKRMVKAAKSRDINRILSFGTAADALFRLVACTAEAEGARVTARCSNKTLTYKLGLSGKHQALNSVAVLAAVYAVGGDMEAAARGFAELVPQSGRGKEYVLKLPQGVCLLIDDTYNASAASIEAALAVLNERRQVMGGRAVAVLGDMLELGASAKKLHTSLAAPIETQATDVVFTVGQNMKYLHEALPKEKQGGHFAVSTEAGAAVAACLKSGDVILVKGSRGTRMEQVVQYLLQHGSTAGVPSGVVHAV